MHPTGWTGTWPAGSTSAASSGSSSIRSRIASTSPRRCSGLALRELIPWWLVGILVARELFLLTLLPRIRRSGRLALPVTYVGKSATFCLLWGFPLLLLGGLPTFGAAALAFGWAFALWGTYLYWWAGLRYAQQAFELRAPA